MNQRTLRILEFDKIKSMLEAYAAFSLGRERIKWLEPHSDLEVVKLRMQETTEAAALLDREGSVPLGGLTDIRPAIRKASLGSLVSPSELLAIGQAAYGIRRLAEFMKAKTADFPLLHELGSRLTVFRRLEDEINRCIGDEGEVLDSASPELARIRSQIRTLQNRVREKLESILHGSQYQRILQESIITMRNGRYVIPIKAEYRGMLSGIVHDQSGSGATLFVEPAAVVEINNKIRQLEADEQEEIERILRYLSGIVAENETELRYSLETAGQIDFAVAKANFSHALRCVEPQLNKEGYIHIVRGRHPLLKGEVVPLDVWLGKDFSTLVITGPNTGGKTVALKTIGLLTLMAQSGLHVPAGDGTQLAIFDSVFADIGDEQSIEQSLSTFSSHMTHIVDIINEADAHSLVLLDELGAGTDPTEGACLAMAILATLHKRGVRTVATTHYSELKTFAHTQDGFANASVEFDVQTLRPTYRLLIGVPGRSNAFAISRRLGLPDHIIDLARAFMSGEEVRVEDLIAELEKDRREAARDRAEAVRLRGEVEQLRAEYEEKLHRLTQEKESILEEAKRQAYTIVQDAKQLADDSLGQIRRIMAMHASGGSERSREDEVKMLRDILDEAKSSLQKSSKKEQVKAVSPMRADQNIEVGDRVRVVSLNQLGDVVHLDPQGNVTVQVGPMRMTVKLGEVVLAEKGKLAQAGQLDSRPITALRSNKSLSVSPELDLRGETVESALRIVDKYLDDAFLAGLARCRIIHGKGTGALRNAICSMLDGHTLVKAHYFAPPNDGGDGVTIVDLAR